MQKDLFLPMTSTGVVLQVDMATATKQHGTEIPGHELVFAWDGRSQTAEVYPAVSSRQTVVTPLQYASSFTSVVIIISWVTYVMVMRENPGFARRTHAWVEFFGLGVAYTIISTSLWNTGMPDWLGHNAAPFLSHGSSVACVVLMIIGTTVAYITSVVLLFLRASDGAARSPFSETVVLSAFFVQFVGETRMTYQMLMCAGTALVWTYNQTRECARIPRIRLQMLLLFDVLCCLPFAVFGAIYPLIENTERFPDDIALATTTVTFGTVAFALIGILDAHSRETSRDMKR
jgi:hypothetical protein